MVLFHLPFQHDYQSEMEEERLAVLALVWDDWYPTLRWIGY